MSLQWGTTCLRHVPTQTHTHIHIRIPKHIKKENRKQKHSESMLFGETVAAAPATADTTTAVACAGGVKLLLFNAMNVLLFSNQNTQLLASWFTSLVLGTSRNT